MKHLCRHVTRLYSLKSLSLSYTQYIGGLLVWLLRWTHRSWTKRLWSSEVEWTYVSSKTPLECAWPPIGATPSVIASACYSFQQIQEDCIGSKLFCSLGGILGRSTWHSRREYWGLEQPSSRKGRTWWSISAWLGEICLKRRCLASVSLWSYFSPISEWSQ